MKSLIHACEKEKVFRFICCTQLLGKNETKQNTQKKKKAKREVKRTIQAVQKKTYNALGAEFGEAKVQESEVVVKQYTLSGGMFFVSVCVTNETNTTNKQTNNITFRCSDNNRIKRRESTSSTWIRLQWRRQIIKQIGFRWSKCSPTTSIIYESTECT